MPMIRFIYTVIITLSSSCLISYSQKSSNCLLTGTGDDSFEWDSNDNVSYTRGDELCVLTNPLDQYLLTENNCVNQKRSKFLRSAAGNSIESTAFHHHQLKILMIGDSFDHHLCYYLRQKYKTVPYHSVKKCFNSSLLIINYERIYGIEDLNRHFHQVMTGITQRHAHQPPDMILFSSIAWDLKNSRDKYCSQSTKPYSTLNNCYCNFKAGSNRDATCNYQQISDKLVPWCSKEFFLSWKTAFHESIQSLQHAFPQAIIFYRNQPFTSSIMMGGESCLGMLNNEIRHTALTTTTVSSTTSQSVIFHLRQHEGQQQLNNITIKSTTTSSSSTPTAIKQFSLILRLVDVKSLLVQGIHHLGVNTGPTSQPRDHLHYFTAVSIWTNYVLTILLNSAVVIDNSNDIDIDSSNIS